MMHELKGSQRTVNGNQLTVQEKTKGKMPKSKLITILVVSLNVNGLVKDQYIPSGQAMNW
jgi:hypothetical protein